MAYDKTVLHKPLRGSRDPPPLNLLLPVRGSVEPTLNICRNNHLEPRLLTQEF